MVRRNVPGIALALMVGVAGCVSAETSSEGDIYFSDVDLSLDGVTYNKRGVYIRPDNPEGQHSEAALCVDYFVSRENVAAFFKLATPMTNREIHDDQDLFIGPCFIEGRAKSLRTDARYRWTITGGGVGTISHPERGYQKFGCKGNCCKAVKLEMCLPEP